jgi:zinc transport system substrate-binding protein
VYKRIIVAVLLIFLPVLAMAEVNVFVSVLPLKYFVERVGGKRVDVSVMVGPGQSPETYAPTPKQMQQLTKTQIYYRVGVPFEIAWINKIKAINPRMQIIDLRSGIKLYPSDPHIWTDPILVMQMAETIRDSLTKIDPAAKTIYQKNYIKFINDLKNLDQYIQAKLKNMPSHTFLVFHPAWGYFARQYGLEQIAIEKEGKEPGPQDLAKTISLAREKGIKLVIVQPQFSKSQAQMIASELGAKIVVLDPLAEDYLNNMQKVCQSIIKI